MKKIPELTPGQKAAIQTKNVSDSIRYLDSEGYSRADIARILNKRYQHVRNVLVARQQSVPQKKKTTFTLRTSVLEGFERLVAEIGLRRDSFLSNLIDDALSALQARAANSEETQELVKEYFRPDPVEMVESGELSRINLSLDEALIGRMNSICKQKLIPRDLFVDGIVEVAAFSLGQAADSIRDPIFRYEETGQRFCGDYLLSDDEADELRASMEDDLVTVQAIANVKDISFQSAIKSYHSLPLMKRRKLQCNPDIEREAARIRAESVDVPSLDDLLG